MARYFQFFVLKVENQIEGSGIKWTVRECLTADLWVKRET